FVERDGAAARVLGENLAALGIGSEAGELRRGEAAQALRSARAAKETYDLVFIDPPYGQAREWALELGALLPALLEPGARVAVESDRRGPLELEMAIERQRRYGDTSITIHRYT
ncbi:MAG: RsmD family RNA methyltransferase, partial [Solirubrobacterales bacterium]|nr:RsmD family RNA methyltransferase [Solirubrobacterales bacterium]